MGNVAIGSSTTNALLTLSGGVGSLSTGISFGDGDSGIYERVDDELRFRINDNDRAYLTSSVFATLGGSAPLLQAASPGSPSVVPGGSDTNTGIGLPVGASGDSDQLSLFAVELISFQWQRLG